MAPVVSQASEVPATPVAVTTSDPASSAGEAPTPTPGPAVSTLEDKNVSTWAYWRKAMPSIPTNIWDIIIVEKGFDQPDIFYHTFKHDQAFDTFLLKIFGDDWDISPHSDRPRQIISWMKRGLASTPLPMRPQIRTISLSASLLRRSTRPPPFPFGRCRLL